VLVIFTQFSAAAHISRKNYTKIAGDRPRQPEHELFSIKRIFQQRKFRLPKFKQSSLWQHQIWLNFKMCNFW